MKKNINEIPSITIRKYAENLGLDWCDEVARSGEYTLYQVGDDFVIDAAGDPVFDNEGDGFDRLMWDFFPNEQSKYFGSRFESKFFLVEN